VRLPGAVSPTGETIQGVKIKLRSQQRHLANAIELVDAPCAMFFFEWGKD